MSDSDSEDYETYYHYTDKDSAEKIADSGVIYQSKEDGAADDAVCGDGVYLTQLDPSNDPRDIADNNYDDGYSLPESKLDDGKVDYVVEVQLKEDKVEDYSEALDRDVHLYPDNDLDLEGDDVKDYAIYPNY